jgi:hypothetical protein
MDQITTIADTASLAADSAAKAFKASQRQETLASSEERTLALAEQLKALANSGISERVPSTRNCVGECGSVRILCTAVAGLMFLAHVRPNEMKKS